MKIRVRLHKKTVIATLSDEEPPTLAILATAAKHLFEISNCNLSLNGKDVIDTEDSALLSSIGIVSGDLVHILTAEEPPLLVKGYENKPSVELDEKKNAQQLANEHNCQSPASTSSSVVHPGSSAAGAASGGTVDFSQMEMDDEDCIRDDKVNRYLREPFLIQETSDTAIPYSLEKIFSEVQPRASHDALALVLLVLMYETGFRLDDGGQQRNPSENVNSIPIPESWRLTSHYEMSYVHPTCPDILFKMTLAPLGSELVVHGYPRGGNLNIYVFLDITTEMFIKSINKTALNTYCQLPRLSRMFKDGFAHPLLNKTRNELGLHSSNSLISLPYEVMMLMLTFLDAKSLCRISGVCVELKQLSRHPSLWRQLYLKEFGRCMNNDLSQHWFQLYKDKYIERAAMRELMRQYTLVAPPWLDRPHPPLPFAPVYPPGFVGGDYDREPVFLGLI